MACGFGRGRGLAARPSGVTFGQDSDTDARHVEGPRAAVAQQQLPVLPAGGAHVVALSIASRRQLRRDAQRVRGRGHHRFDGAVVPLLMALRAVPVVEPRHHSRVPSDRPLARGHGPKQESPVEARVAPVQEGAAEENERGFRCARRKSVTRVSGRAQHTALLEEVAVVSGSQGQVASSNALTYSRASPRDGCSPRGSPRWWRR